MLQKCCVWFRAKVIALLSGLPRGFWVIWWGTVINRLGDFVAPFLLLYLTIHLKMPIPEASVVVGAKGLGNFFGQLFGGSFSDRWGRKKVMLWSLWAKVILMLILSQQSNFYALIVAVFMMGWVERVYGPASSAAIADLTTSFNRTRAYSLLYWAINIGAGISPIMAGFLWSKGYVWLFGLDAASTAVLALLLWAFFPESYTKNSGHSSFVFPKDGLLYQATALNFMLGLMWFQGFGTLSLYMQHLGYTPKDYGQIIAVNGFMVVALGIPVGIWASKMRTPQALVLAALFTGVGLGMNEFAHSYLFLVGAVLVWTVGEMLQFALSKTLIADIAPDHMRGSYQGVGGSAFSLAGAVAPIVGGFLLLKGWLWWSCMLVAVPLAVGYWYVGKLYERRMQTKTPAI